MKTRRAFHGENSKIRWLGAPGFEPGVYGFLRRGQRSSASSSPVLWVCNPPVLHALEPGAVDLQPHLHELAGPRPRLQEYLMGKAVLNFSREDSEFMIDNSGYFPSLDVTQILLKELRCHGS